MNFSFLQCWIISTIDWFYKPFRTIIPQQTFRYAACGGGNMVLDIFLYFISYNFILDKEIVNLGFTAVSPYIAAFIISFCVTFPTGFLLNKFITFQQSDLRGRVQLFRYGLIVLGSIAINYVLIKLFVEQLGIYPTPSKMLATGFVIIFSYFSQKHYSFKSSSNPCNSIVLEAESEVIIDNSNNS